MTLQLLQPNWLWLLVPAAALVAMAVRRLRDEEFGRLATVILLRAALLSTVILILARPMLERVRDDLAVIAVVDVSGSVRQLAAADASRRGDAPPLAALRGWLEEALEQRGRDDRFGLVIFDGERAVLATPGRRGLLDDSIDRPMADGTDIAAAIRLARALFPPDASRRILLVSDGNQTMGNAIDAATGTVTDAHGPVAVDVLPIVYRLENEVQVLRIEAPSVARTGQTVSMRVVMESTRPTTGRLTMTHEGALLDLDPQSSGTSRRISVPAGLSVHVATVPIDARPLHRVVAIFEPEDPADDTLVDNNSAEAVLTNSGTNAALLVRGASRRGTPSAMEQLLTAASIPVTTIAAESLPDDLLTLQAYDLVILDDVGANEVDTDRQELLAEFVDRLGGGLLVAGGPNSFGAGGWRGSPLEPILPVSLDVPRQLQRPATALVIVLDKSGSMAFPVAGARASQQEIANEAAALAVESLSARSLVGVIAFDHAASVVVPLNPNDDPDFIVDRIRGIRAGGGTDIAAALAAVERMLDGVEVERRQVVFLTDGVSRPGDPQVIAGRMADEGVRITTIGVGDDIDIELLRELAEIGGGEFHWVRNPRSLPRVLVDSVRMVNRPLIREEAFVPVVQPTGSGLFVGSGSLPPLRGIVLTTARPAPTAAVELLTPTNEPVLASWQAGLGRVVAFTSDLDGPWAADWIEWPGWGRLWTELARRTSRPAFGAGLAINAQLTDGGLTVTVDIDADADEALDPAQLFMEGIVYGPDGRRMPIRLRQVAARRFEQSIGTDAAGTHIAVISPRLGERPLAPLVVGVTRPLGEEYRDSRSNVAMLREIAETTGGRLLDLADAGSARLYDKRGLTPTSALRPLWPFLAWVALVLLLADVAARRIAWSPIKLRAAIAAAARRGGRESPATLSAVVTAVRERSPHREVPRTPAPQSPLRAPPAQPALREPGSRKEVATAREAALRAIGGEPGPLPRTTKPEEAPPDQVEPEPIPLADDATAAESTPSGAAPPRREDPIDDGSAMSRLKAAKRRATRPD